MMRLLLSPTVLVFFATILLLPDRLGGGNPSTFAGAESTGEECEVGADGSCTPLETPACQDADDRCEFWSKEGECENNPGYMLKNCRISCNTCEVESKAALDALVKSKLQERDEKNEKEADVTETPYGVKQSTHDKATRKMVESMTDYMENRVFKEPKYAKVKNDCRNRHNQCAYWATIGECEANPPYMLLQCAPMCQTCENIDFDSRCPVNHTVPTILNPGDLDEMFLNLTTLDWYQQYEPVIHSMPHPPSEGGKAIKTGPWVVTLENLLTDEECDRLIELGGKQGFQRSMDVGKKKFDGTYEGFENSGRTSTNAWCQDECYDDELTQQVIKKIENVTGVPDANSEYLQLLRYEPKQFYRTHHDYIEHHTNRQEGVRILTVFLYLNDVEAGGGTDFPKLGITVMPKKGKALIWPSVLNDDPNSKDYRTDHQALPVEAGIKFGANAWLHQRDFKEAFARSCH